MPDILIAEPARIVAGDTFRLLKQVPAYPASAGWVLTYTLVNAGARYTFSGTASGDEHLISVSAATTGAWAAGDYAYRAQVAKAGEIYTVGEGRITIAPAFGAALDTRSQARRMLEAVEATIEGRAVSDVQQYEIAGRRLAKIPIPELLVLRDRLRVDVARETDAQRAAAGLAPRGRIAVRFGA